MIIYKPKLSYRVYLSFEAAIKFLCPLFFWEREGKKGGGLVLGSVAEPNRN
jgi:hypothetical protein